MSPTATFSAKWARRTSALPLDWAAPAGPTGRTNPAISRPSTAAVVSAGVRTGGSRRRRTTVGSLAWASPGPDADGRTLYLNGRPRRITAFRDEHAQVVGTGAQPNHPNVTGWEAGSEVRGELGPGVREQLGQDPGLADDRHEVGVPAPARHQVQVGVVGDAGPGDLAQVHAEVEPVRLRLGPQAAQPGLGQGHQLAQLRGGQLGVVADVAEGRDHQVPGVVREAVEDGEDQLAPAKDQVGPVVPGRGQVTEDAAAALVSLVALAGVDVGHPPRRPQALDAHAPPAAGSGGRVAGRL